MANEIGAVETVKVSAFGTPVGAPKQPLASADDVFSDELVETVAGGALHIRFLDDTNLRLGSASQVRLDQFVYDPATGSEKLVVELGQGMFRLVTGNITSEKIEIVTPVGIVGVRGTDFVLHILLTSIVIAVISGSVTFKHLIAGIPELVVGESDTASVDASGQIESGVPIPPVDIGLGHDAARALLAIMQLRSDSGPHDGQNAPYNEAGEEAAQGDQDDESAVDVDGAGGLAGSGSAGLGGPPELDGDSDQNDPNELLTQLEGVTNHTEGVTLEGGDGFDLLIGGPGNDLLRGHGGIDVLFGNAGDDTLEGGEGIDGLIGGPGADTLTGGPDFDVFFLAPGDGGATLALADVITDFTPGEDFIILIGLDDDDITIGADGDDAFIQVTATGEFLARGIGTAGLIDLDIDVFDTIAEIPTVVPDNLMI